MKPLRRGRRWHSAPSVVLALLIMSCATEPSDYELPEPDLSLDQAALVEPRVLFMCDGWVDGSPPLDIKIFVDVSFVRRTLDDPYAAPTKGDLATISRHGGQVVYKFHSRAIRAFMPTASIPQLGNEPSVNLIFRVANVRRYDWISGVMFRKSYPLAQGAERFRELGGRVEYQYTSINAVSGLLPDRSLSTLRADPNVEHVESLEGFPNRF